MKLVPTTIVEHLDKNGTTSFKELFELVHKRVPEISEQEFNYILMEIEIQGLIKVYQLPKGKKSIERA
jgi:hypothetical protein